MNIKGKKFKKLNLVLLLLFVLSLLPAGIFNLPDKTDAKTKKVTISITNPSVKNGTATFDKMGTKTEKFKLAYKVSDGQKPESVKFTSSKKKVASVNSKGVVSVKKTGTTKITVKATMKNGTKATKSFNLKVIKPKLTITAPTKASSYTYNKTTNYKEHFELKYSLNTEAKKVTYKASNKVVSVDKNGMVTVNKGGKVKITVTAKLKNNKTVKDVITINVSDYSFKLKDSLGKAKNGIICVKPSQKAFSVKPKTTKPVKGIAYASSNEAVVSVDKNGKVTVKGEGTAVISVTAKYDNGVKVTENVIVVVDKSGKAPVADKDTDTGKDEVTDSDAVKEIVFFKDMGILNEKDVMEYKKTSKADEQFSISLTAVNFVPVLTVYNSSNTDVATVDNAGMLTFKGAGTTVITVWATDVSGQIVTGSLTVEVKDESKSDGGFSQEVDPSTCKHVFFFTGETEEVDIPEDVYTYTITEEEIASFASCTGCDTLCLGVYQSAIDLGAVHPEYQEMVEAVVELAEKNGGFVYGTTGKKFSITLDNFGEHLEKCDVKGSNSIRGVKTGRIIEKVKTETVPAHKHTFDYLQCPKCGTVKKEYNKRSCGVMYCQHRDQDITHTTY